MKHRVTFVSFVLLVSSAVLCAQSPNAIPVPSQLTTARTVFVSYAGSRWYAQGDGILVYQSVRTGLASIGYTLVQNPADAELSAEASVTGDAVADVRLHVAVYDTKTRTLLWVFDDPMNGRVDKTIPKNLDKAVEQFTADLRALSSGPVAVPTAADKKTRMSQEPK